MKIPPLPRPAARGFTLTELLIVISIIAVLAALLFPIYRSATRSAENVKCTANLRNMATGIRQYTAEYDGRLPGPLFSGQGPYYNRDMRRLQNRIGKYLEIPPSNTWSTKGTAMTYTPVFECPSTKRKSVPGTNTLRVNLSYKVDGASPFGSGDADGNGVLNSPNDVPPATTLLQMVEAEADKTWMIMELDQAVPGLGKPGWFNSLVPGPAHGNHRNAVFFDLHIGRLDVDNVPL